MKEKITDLAFFGGAPLFETPISTSNLVKPSLERFLNYSKVFYKNKKYTGRGELVVELEKRLCSFHETDYCVTFCSGFWALVGAIKNLALEGKSEVIMPSLTYRRLADVVSWAGLTPRFCEVDTKTLSISPKEVEKIINKETSLIIGVHPIVNCCDALGLEKISADYNIPLLFDTVESVYETYSGKKTGGFGDAECFSFHASKLINGFEGGYITTNDFSLYKKIMKFSCSDGNGHVGINGNLNEMHAAMALSGLDEINDNVAHNKKIYKLYSELFSKIRSVRVLEFDEKERTSYKNIVFELLPEWKIPRKKLIDILNKENILSRAYYYPPLHMKNARYKTIFGDLQKTEILSEKFILMPCGFFVKEEDVRKIYDLFLFIEKESSSLI